MSKVLNQKINFGMFFQAIGGRIQDLMASALTPEEKLAQIIKACEIEVQSKRQLAREIGGQLRAICDHETRELEPLEALQARRVKLVRLGGSLVDQPEKSAQIGQLSQEIKALDSQINGQQATYDTLKESYELATGNYQQAWAALETIRRNGSAILKAIEAHKQALSLKDKANSGSDVDTSFLSELQGELSQVQAELRSDNDIDKDLNATNIFSIDAALSKMDEESIDADLLAEFQAAK